MSGTHVKKRKAKNATSKPSEASRSQQSSRGSGFGSGRFLWVGIPLLIAFGSFLYFKPLLVTDIIGSEWAKPDLKEIEISADTEKRDAVVEAFKHAWRAYERDAMGDDEYHPITRKGTNLTEAGGIGYTVIDSIDTMQLMGLTEDYTRARDWVEKKLSFDQDAEFSTFEVRLLNISFCDKLVLFSLLQTTIRVLGGLLSAYHLSGEDTLYLDKAIELADRIMPTFDTPSGLPYPSVNLAKRTGIPDKALPHLVSTAEVSTLQLELRYLSMLTANEEYWDKAENVMRVIKGALPTGYGLATIYMHVKSGKFVPSDIRLGSRGDSYYEYLLKQYLQTNRTESVYHDMYSAAVDAIHEHLIRHSPHAGLIYTAEFSPERTTDGQLSWRLSPKQDHLVCFFGGSLMLGATMTRATVSTVSVPPKAEELTSYGERDWENGEELVKTCMATHDTATGLSPEIVYFRMDGDEYDTEYNEDSDVPSSDWYIKGARRGHPPPYDARYILRPETVESLFIAFRLTGDQKYRKWGWDIFQSIEKHCRIETGGYASVIDVDEVPTTKEDRMETFLMSETLKYLYLLFSDKDVLPLDKYVFNTEAHPLPIFTPTGRTAFS
ncbi:hypothetical protein E1B28_001821 [Marasmius oreades]|uniref:alpha-1,2-Mannosidase n=1 Tax=Marasmius oreades TaxID=181124 RepID=A0A9P8AG52_9AGAR|nr:uncharacterized protein E1B28_001821 [Marasmius oreades]KAG7100035.1 hypothetical protein E1B28_001821 [Marasmius oreades]